MSEKLSQSQKLLHDSLFELYMQGGLELYLAAAHGMKRDLIIELETSALTPEKGEIIHYYAVNRWDDDDDRVRHLIISHLNIEGCRLNVGVPQQMLNSANANPLLAERRCESSPPRMRAG